MLERSTRMRFEKPVQSTSAMAISRSLHQLEAWIRSRDFAGHEPFDLMNSPYLGAWARKFPFNAFSRQFGKRFAGLRTRRILRVPPSKNCKALGLMLAGYCDLQRCNGDWEKEARYLVSELKRLRSPGES